MMKRSGFTLLELLIVVAIVGILAAIAAPSMKTYIDQGRLTGAVEDLASMIYYARSESLAKNRDIYVDIQGSGTADWCVGVSTDNYCNCDTGAPACELNTVGGVSSVAAKSLNGTDFSVVTLTAAPATQWIIQVPRGVVTAPSTLTLNHADVGDVEVQINKLGRVKVCSDALNRYSDC